MEKKTNRRRLKEVREIKKQIMRAVADIVNPPEGIDLKHSSDDKERTRILRERHCDLEWEAGKNDRKKGNMFGKWKAKSLVAGREHKTVLLEVDHYDMGWEHQEVRPPKHDDDGLVWRRKVGMRGLLEKDINRNASGYEWIKIHNLEGWFSEVYYKNAFCEKGGGGLNKDKFILEWRPTLQQHDREDSTARTPTLQQMRDNDDSDSESDLDDED